MAEAVEDIITVSAADVVPENLTNITQSAVISKNQDKIKIKIKIKSR